MSVINIDQGQLTFSGMASVHDLMWGVITLPKVDLHRHLTGSIDIETALHVSAKFSLDLPSYDFAELDNLLISKSNNGDLRQYFRPWEVLNRLFSSPSATYDLVMRTIANAASDNVIYQELRMGPRGFLGHDPLISFESFLDAVVKAILDGEKQYGTCTRCILGLSRHNFLNASDRMLAKIISILVDYRDKGFVGVDLNGDERACSGERFKTFFRLAREYGFNVTIHAGEVGPPSNIEYAIRELGASRIGHGLSAIKDEAILKLMADKECLVELAPTSYKLLSVLSSIDELPLEKFQHAGIPVAICTDNPARCKTSLSQELYKVSIAFALSLAEIKALTLDAIEHSFAEYGVKAALRRKVMAFQYSSNR